MTDTLLIVICLGSPLVWILWRSERRRVAEETRRTVMASVMDTQNNLLNNIVYFRFCAETGKPINPTDLQQIDCAVRETQARLVEIAEAEIQDTRDLGGIRVFAPSKASMTS